MANLKGGNFEKQIKDAFFRTLAYGQGRHNSQDNLTHSVGLADKRKMYLQDFKNYLEQKGIREGKINQMMKEGNIRNFLEDRTINLSAKVSLDYVTGFNSLLKGLQQANITIPINLKKDFLKDFREHFREEIKKIEVEKGRYIKNLEQKLYELRGKNYESYVVAKLQANTGLRVREALEVAKNFNKYFNPRTNTLNNIIGKGNHQYAPKPISPQLVKEIQKMDKTPTYQNYLKDLKDIGIDKSHDFRVTFAKNSLTLKLEQGMQYKEALKKVSEEINHHRPEMTKYYLNRA
jgi:uncharacterized protein YnzC (UPF0291/DUF896 family)